MNNREIIAKLYDLSDTLDQQEQYRYSDDIQSLATRLAILNLPPQRLDHPGTYDLKKNYLEPLPPQNLLETLYQDFAGYGKPIPKIKLPFFPETKIDWTPDKFFADIVRDFEGTGHINNDFQHLLIQSPKFVNLLHDYIFVKNEGNTRLLNQFKEMIEKGEFAFTYQLRTEFKKLKKYIDDYHKTNIVRVLPALLKISEILPTEFRSEVQAMNEWLENQRSNEAEIYDAERAYEPKYEDKLNAHKELKDYLTPTDEELENLQRNKISNMNKRHIIASLNNISNHLDNNGLYGEANILTNIMKRLAVSPDEIIGEDEIPSRKSPKSEIGGYNQEKANMVDFLSSTLSELSEDELPRWIKEKRDRSQNPPKPEVLHPSEEEQRQKVDDIFPTFMKSYEQFWDQHNVALPSSMDPREINQVTEYYLVIGQGDPVDFLKTYHVINSPDYKDSSRYIDWYKENFDFMVEHMKFIDNFQKSNNLDRSTMFALLINLENNNK